MRDCRRWLLSDMKTQEGEEPVLSWWHVTHKMKHCTGLSIQQVSNLVNDTTSHSQTQSQEAVMAAASAFFMPRRLSVM